MEEIIANSSGERLDKFIANNIDLSRVMIQRLIEEGNILVNEKTVKPSYKIEKGDKIWITSPEVKETNLKAQEIPLNIIYEDNDIIVVNKEKGMVVHPAVRKFRWYFSKCSYGTLQG